MPETLPVAQYLQGEERGREKERRGGGKGYYYYYHLCADLMEIFRVCPEAQVRSRVVRAILRPLISIYIYIYIYYTYTQTITNKKNNKKWKTYRILYIHIHTCRCILSGRAVLRSPTALGPPAAELVLSVMIIEYHYHYSL